MQAAGLRALPSLLCWLIKFDCVSNALQPPMQLPCMLCLLRLLCTLCFDCGLQAVQLARFWRRRGSTHLHLSYFDQPRPSPLFFLPAGGAAGADLSRRGAAPTCSRGFPRQRQQRKRGRRRRRRQQQRRCAGAGACVMQAAEQQHSTLCWHKHHCYTQTQARPVRTAGATAELAPRPPVLRLPQDSALLSGMSQFALPSSAPPSPIPLQASRPDSWCLTCSPPLLPFMPACLPHAPPSPPPTIQACHFCSSLFAIRPTHAHCCFRHSPHRAHEGFPSPHPSGRPHRRAPPYYPLPRSPLTLHGAGLAPAFAPALPRPDSD